MDNRVFQDRPVTLYIILQYACLFQAKNAIYLLEGFPCLFFFSQINSDYTGNVRIVFPQLPVLLVMLTLFEGKWTYSLGI